MTDRFFAESQLRERLAPYTDPIWEMIYRDLDQGRTHLGVHILVPTESFQDLAEPDGLVGWMSGYPIFLSDRVAQPSVVLSVSPAITRTGD